MGSLGRELTCPFCSTNKRQSRKPNPAPVPTALAYSCAQTGWLSQKNVGEVEVSHSPYCLHASHVSRRIPFATEDLKKYGGRGGCLQEVILHFRIFDSYTWPTSSSTPTACSQLIQIKQGSEPSTDRAINMVPCKLKLSFQRAIIPDLFT